MYRGPRMNDWSTQSASQVRARLNIYKGRADKGEVSEAIERGLETWTWAYSLFGSEQIIRQDNMSTIHHPGEGVTT